MLRSGSFPPSLYLRNTKCSIYLIIFFRLSLLCETKDITATASGWNIRLISRINYDSRPFFSEKSLKNNIMSSKFKKSKREKKTNNIRDFSEKNGQFSQDIGRLLRGWLILHGWIQLLWWKQRRASTQFCSFSCAFWSKGKYISFCIFFFAFFASLSLKNV